MPVNTGEYTVVRRTGGLVRIYILLVSLCMTGVLNAQAQLGGSGSGSGLGSYRQQQSADPNRPKEYELAGITVSGAQYLDQDLLISVSNLIVGQKIRLPNDENISKAVRALWKQELFSNIEITVSKIIDDKIFLNIAVEERPRLSKYNFKNIKTGEAKELKNKMPLVTNKVVTDATRKEAMERIKKHYVDKGYGRVQVSVIERKDTLAVNKVILTFYIQKGVKTHINQVNIAGAENATEARLKRTLKGTKEMSHITLHPDKAMNAYGSSKRSFGKYMREFGFLSLSKTMDALDPYFRFKFFASSKFNQTKFEEDKQALVAYYNTLGFRDATIDADTVYPVRNGNLNVDIKVREGHKYYFGDINWKGNTKYSSEVLARVLGIKKGDVYNQALLETRMGRQLNPEGGEDVSSLYMDDGYLFFNIEPVEMSIVGDTINYEMRITEGAQATIREIGISGNDRTNEHVIRRELYTYPGDKFSRSALIRSQREIANLGFFDQEKIGLQPKPHPEDGTVDIDYSVVEKSSDQLQLSAGFGGGVNFYGNIGITFNNFSARNIFRPKFWDPLPVGDGQKFSITYASNGPYYNALTTSFTEPWLGGRRPNALSASLTFNRMAPQGASGNTYLQMLGGGLSMGKRLSWPDNFFVFNYGLYFNNYKLKNYNLIQGVDFANGTSNDLNVKLVLSRNSLDGPLYPRGGSNIAFTFQFTPPYSMFTGKDYTNESTEKKYKWIEYHKYRFVADWYQKVHGNLVLRLGVKYGFMGYYNQGLGYSPFGRYQLGGDGMTMGQFFIGKEIISQRGYDPYAQAATIFNKYVAELRYPFSLSPTATIYGLAFVDAANAWNNFTEYNPLKLNRDAGVGIRVFLPMFGLLGLDYGVGFDKYDPTYGVTGLKSLAKFTFMLGFEPD
ncbi:outer membrane protein assembly factor BamA [Nemorincola caseinilytica]|uniref:Outer membrane protein assembly factor BamA n=2 Tax=Nemorincola caseinilytica TaxID=2054315 RepID=A0ABP8NMJ8_9BACT